MRVIELGTDVDYHEAWRLQRRLHEAVAGGADATLLLLEHRSVYTAGTSTRQADLPTNGAEAVPVDRGGRITWHGPGQLVGYPIVAPGVPPVDWVRMLEQAIMLALAEWGLATTRVDGRAGVWLLGEAGEAGDGGRAGVDRKIAQIGVRMRQGTSMHGVAINVRCDLAAFDAIVPCGITDAGVTSVAAELGADAPAVAEVGAAFGVHLAALLGTSPAHETLAALEARLGASAPSAAGALAGVVA